MNSLKKCHPQRLKSPTQTFEYSIYVKHNIIYHNKILQLQNPISIEHHRWATYIHKKKVLTHICKKIINNDNNIVIAYADSSFQHNSKAYASTLKSSWVRKKLLNQHKAKALMINEFNISPGCSESRYPVNLVGLGSKDDPQAQFVKKEPKKPIS